MTEWKEVVAEWIGESVFCGHATTGATIQMGSFADKPGISPMEMLLLGTAGCTGMDIVSILQKKRQDLQRLEIRVRGLRAEDYPKIYTDIEVIYVVWGDVQAEAVDQAIALSKEKYCSVSLMLGEAARITTRYEIHPAVVVAVENMG